MTKAHSMNGVVKSYRGFKLGPINLELESGVVLGLIGPTGAGNRSPSTCCIPRLSCS